MRIYALIKTFLLFVIVAGIGVIIWAGLSHLGSANSKLPALENSAPVTLDRVSLSLQLDSPDNKTVLFDQSLLVSGKTSPKATIIVNDDGDYSGVTADSGGSFSKRITLDDGLNQLTVTAFDSEGNSKTEHRTVYYSADQL